MASHGPRAPLEALPTEILQTILSQMTCTDDLSAAIKASPTIFQSFLGWREGILIRVIQSSLGPGIFMEVVGLLDVPNFGNLHYVPGPFVAGRSGMHIGSWFAIRAHEQNRLAREFEEEHSKRLTEGLESGAPHPFPIPRTRPTVNTVVGIFVRLKRHMEESFNSSSVRCRDIWVPAKPFSCEVDATVNSSGVIIWNRRLISLTKPRRLLRDVFEMYQRQFLRELLWKKLFGYEQ